MKKFKLFLPVLFVAAMMFSFKITAFAAEDSLTITGSHTTAKPGDEVTFTVKITNGTEGVSSAQADVVVSSNLQYLGYELGEDTKNTGMITVPQNGGKFVFAGNSTDRQGKNFSITFKYKVSDTAEAGDEITFKVDKQRAWGTKLNEKQNVIELETVKTTTGDLKATIVKDTPQTPDEDTTGTTEPNPNTNDINLTYILVVMALSGLGLTYALKKRFN